EAFPGLDSSPELGGGQSGRRATRQTGCRGAKTRSLALGGISGHPGAGGRFGTVCPRFQEAGRNRSIRRSGGGATTLVALTHGCLGDETTIAIGAIAQEVQGQARSQSPSWRNNSAASFAAALPGNCSMSSFSRALARSGLLLM